MSEEKIIIPTKEEIKKMLEYAINSDIVHQWIRGKECSFSLEVVRK